MVLLNTATKIYQGAAVGLKAYLGDTQVWPSGSPPVTIPYVDRIKSLNPISYWRLGEPSGTVGVDQMGFHNGTYVGSVGLGLPSLLNNSADTSMEVFGTYGPNGMTANNLAEYQIDIFTVEAWIKTSNAGASLRSIVVKQNTFGIFLMDNCLCPYEWVTGGFINSYINVADGESHHIVVVYNGSASQTYLDGLAVGPVFTHTPFNQVQNMDIGFNAYNGQEFAGIIDEVAFYGRALTAAEIADNYISGISIITPPAWTPDSVPGLVTWFDPAQDLFLDGERVTSYREHSSAHREFIPEVNWEGPIFRGGGYPYLDFGSDGSDGGLTCTDPTITFIPGTTFIAVCAVTGGSYPMMVVIGPDANGIEMRHDGTSMQVVVMYSAYSLYWSHPTPMAHTKALHAIRITPGSASEGWINSIRHAAGAPGAMLTSPQTIYVGRRQGGYPFFGPMYETLVYDRPISDTDMGLIMDYLNTKHSLPALRSTT